MVRSDQVTMVICPSPETSTFPLNRRCALLLFAMARSHVTIAICPSRAVHQRCQTFPLDRRCALLLFAMTRSHVTSAISSSRAVHQRCQLDIPAQSEMCPSLASACTTVTPSASAAAAAACESSSTAEQNAGPVLAQQTQMAVPASQSSLTAGQDRGQPPVKKQKATSQYIGGRKWKGGN